MKTEDFNWCNDSGYSDVFNNSLCECTAPQVNDGMCICGRPINDNMTNTLNKNLELREALAEVDRLTSENIKLKDEKNELLLRNEKLREICISLEVQLDDINDLIQKITNNEK